MKHEENSIGDEKHEIEGNWAVRGPQAASERVGTVTEENIEHDSNKEYDDLTKRAWEKAQRSGGTNDEEVHDQTSQSQGFFRRTPCYQQEIVTDSDRDSNVDRWVERFVFIG